MKFLNKKSGQEEIVGFAIIMILVAVILLVFLGFSLRDKSTELVESYEAESFVQAVLQYTSDCAETYEPNYLSLQQLVIRCYRNSDCLDGRKSCEVLDQTLTQILEESWNVEEESYVIGYVMNISSEDRDIILLQQGNITNNYKGTTQMLGSQNIKIEFSVYY